MRTRIHRIQTRLQLIQLICLLHLMMIPLLIVRDVQLRVLVVGQGLLLQERKQEEEEKILDQSRGLRVGEWTEIDLHLRLLDVDEIGLITTIVVRTVNGSEIEKGTLLLRVGHLRLRLRLLVGRGRGTDLRLHI